MKPFVHLLVLMFLLSRATGQEGTDTNSNNARQFLNRFDAESRKVTTALAQAMWDYYGDVNTQNQQRMSEASAASASVLHGLGVEARKFHLPSMATDVQRDLTKVLRMTQSSALDESKTKELAQVKAEMMSLFHAGRHKITPARSTHEDALLQEWKSIRDNTGKQYKHLYPRYVELSNEAARLRGYEDYGDQWRSVYGQTDFIEEVFRLYNRIKDYYKVLHTFVKYELKKIYPQHMFPKSGHIPAQLLGSGVCWAELLDRVKIIKYGNYINITSAMHDHMYTVKRMYDDANNFYKSMGFPGLPASVWSNSRLVKPKDGKNVVCHSNAWDFYDRRTWRISMCAGVSEEDMKTIYKKMGQLVYFQQYKDQKIYNTGSPNEAFQEAIPDMMGMSFESLEHLEKKNLILHSRRYNEQQILFKKAMLKLPAIIETLIVDLFRWGVFSGRITPENYNKEWWRLQCKYKGVSPPIDRTQDDFDVGRIFHVAGDYSYIRYYIGTFIEFQMYRKVCDSKGHKGPLYLCDISNNTVVGRKFMKFMSAGSSRPWQDLLKEFTKHDDRVKADAVAEYFRDLYINLATKYYSGLKYWNEECDPSPSVG